MTLLHAVPQYQGSAAPNAAELPAGCRALARLAGAVFGVDVHEVPVRTDVSSTVDGVANREVLLRNRNAQLAALEAPGGKVLTIGGDCGVDHVPLSVARYRHGDIGVAWFDAHADLNTAESSPSGGFHGMVLRSCLGEGDPDFAASPALAPGRAVLFGTRAFDPPERAAVDAGLVRHVSTVDASARAAFADDERIYLHVDLDVLAPAAFGAVSYPEPGGPDVADLVAALRSLSDVEIVGAALTECATTDPAVLARLEPVLTALAELLA